MELFWKGQDRINAANNYENDQWLLTIFRHFDSSSVVRGHQGTVPQTVWVLDYPIFERIYYNLVAGFDVYGNVRHQISTRLYMDNLRVESEDNFISLLPKYNKLKYRGAINKKAEKSLKSRNKYFHESLPAKYQFKTSDFYSQKDELLTKLYDIYNFQKPNFQNIYY